MSANFEYSRTVDVYPWQDLGPANITTASNPICDATGDVWYMALYFAGLTKAVMAKYVYSTNTLTELAVLDLATDQPYYICWNSDRTAILAWCTTSGVDTTFKQVTALGAVTTIGTVADTGVLDGMVYSSELGTYLASWGFNAAVYGIDLGTLALTTIFSAAFTGPMCLDGDYLYRPGQKADLVAGPVNRMQIPLGFETEFLTGSAAGTATLLSDNPDYCSAQLVCREVVSNGNEVYLALIIGANTELWKFNKTTKHTSVVISGSGFIWSTFGVVIPSRRMAISDDATKLAVSASYSGLYFYTKT